MLILLPPCNGFCFRLGRLPWNSWHLTNWCQQYTFDSQKCCLCDYSSWQFLNSEAITYGDCQRSALGWWQSTKVMGENKTHLEMSIFRPWEPEARSLKLQTRVWGFRSSSFSSDISQPRMSRGDGGFHCPKQTHLTFHSLGRLEGEVRTI